jgi:hypothetical protein
LANNGALVFFGGSVGGAVLEAAVAAVQQQETILAENQAAVSALVDVHAVGLVHGIQYLRRSDIRPARFPRIALRARQTRIGITTAM